MKTLLCLGLVVGLSLPRVTPRSRDDAKDIQGNWVPVRPSWGGSAMPPAILKTISMNLDKGKYEVLVAGEPDRGTYNMDATTKPKSITVTGVEGVNHGQTFPSIYELKGDTLTICYDLSGAKRPTEFKSAAGTKQYLVTYARARK